MIHSGCDSSVSSFSFAVVVLDQTPPPPPNRHHQQRPRTTPPDRHYLHLHKPNLASIASPAILKRRPTTAQPPRQTSHHLRLPPSQPATTPPVNTERQAVQDPFGDYCRTRRTACANGGLSKGGNGSRELHAPFSSVQWASVGRLCPASKACM